MKTLDTKLNRLKEILESHPHIGIAFSGGVDSTFLIAFAASLKSKVNVTGITVNAPNFAPDEIEYTRDFCREREIPHLMVDLNFSQIEGLKENTPERCYACKKSIFTIVKKIAGENNIFVIADGTNLDDDSDYRPGKRALEELGVISPLKEAGLTKDEIRQALKEMGISIWNKPAFACLASRIPSGEEITEEKLSAIYAVEKAIREAGFTQVRVRHHGQVARIEVLPEEMQSFMAPENLETINQASVKAGFRFAALDLSGYKMGNMNQSIIKKTIAFLLMVTLLFSTGFQTAYADINRNDMRAVWVSTIFNLDYPSVKSDEKAQKEEFIAMLDKLQGAGINTVMVQVRPKADAFYKSSINPWSESLTGTQGQDPGYDPMEFMIGETHKRGMSFHAWLNPYRITNNSTDLNDLSSNHPARLHPEWVMEYKGALYYNPELTEVKKHVVDTVKEIVQNYQVDGIHFDDYFYPSNFPLPEGETRDGAVADQRRTNVNEMVALVYKTIKENNPNVLFGISPMGIWKNRTSDLTGSLTKGSEAYYSVYSDCRAWIKEGTIDYLVPQIYWEIGYEIADYETLVKWWSNEVKNSSVTLYVGQAAYRDPVAEQMDRQLAINQEYSNVKGSVFFRASDIIDNRQGIHDKLKAFYSLKKITGLPSSHRILVDGNAKSFDAYNINGSNYFKLRDVAFTLSATTKRFNTFWDPLAESINLETGTSYSPSGVEMVPGDGTQKEATMTTATLLLDGELTFAGAYNINGNNYYKLRDLGRLLDFGVEWNQDSATVMVDSRSVYSEY